MRRPVKERGERKKKDGGNVTEKVNKMGNIKRGDIRSGEGGTSVCYIKTNNCFLFIIKIVLHGPINNYKKYLNLTKTL